MQCVAPAMGQPGPTRHPAHWWNLGATKAGIPCCINHKKCDITTRECLELPPGCLCPIAQPTHRIGPFFRAKHITTAAATSALPVFPPEKWSTGSTWAEGLRSMGCNFR